MVFIYLLAAAWVAFTFGVCISDFFDFDFNSIRAKTWFEDSFKEPEKPKTLKAAA